MPEENVVAPADVKPPESVPAVPESEAPVQEQKPNREEELQRAVGAANTARRRLERDLAEERLKIDVANKRVEELYKKFAPAEPKPPDLNDDPVGALVHKSDKIDKRLEDWEKREKEREQQSVAQRQQQEFMQKFDRSARAFAAKQSDFTQAQEHLFQDYMAEAKEAGATEEEANQEAWEKWGRVVNRSFESGENPAEKLFNLAKRRGYKGSTQDKIDTIANGSKATSPLSSASGKAPGKLSAEAIASMPQAEFDKLSEADFQRYFGS